MTTPKLQMPELVVGQAGKELTHNQSLAVLDQLAQAVVVDKDLTSPPGSPANGSMYIVAAGATGDWSGQSGKLAYWLTTVAAWTFITPADGWSVWVIDEAVRYERQAGDWIISSSGSTGDILSTLQSTEVSITGATTFTASSFGKMHVCSGTIGDYSVALPAAAGNAGKIIGLRMAAGLTRLVTIDASGAELIDGQATRVMWANEVAILLCDGSAWTKIAGKSLPMSCGMYPSAASITVALSPTLTLMTIDTAIFNNGGMANPASNRIDIRRQGVYRVTAHVYYKAGGGISSEVQCIVNKSAAVGGVGAFTEWRQIPAVEPYRAIISTDAEFATGDYADLYGRVSTTARDAYTNDPTWTYLKVSEVVSW